MTGNLHKADATGKLELSNKVSPIAYDVTVGEEKKAGRYVVKISVSAPRDWLLQRGFKSDATLVKEDGNRVQLRHDGDLDVGDAISVELSAFDDSCSMESELQQKYPELRV
jgi:hypothetical protein